MLSIGSLQIGLPAIAAALSGFSDRPMRMVARRYGADFAMAEVVLDELVLLQGKLRERILKIGDDDHPVGGQLMGSRPEQFGEAANDLVEAGYDLVDINFGCPVKKVLGRCRGGFLLSDPQTALQIVESVVDAVDGRCPVTLKMRRGFDDSADSEKNFFTILDGAFERGAAAITVHGRTVQQRYVGPSKWEFLSRVKRHVGSRKILGSGDVFNANAALRMMEQTGVDGVTVARGAIGNPFIFRECRALLNGSTIAPPSITEQREAMELHIVELLALHNPVRAGAIFRKFGISYADLHPLRAEVRNAFIATRNMTDIRSVIATWYDDERSWPAVVPRETITDLIAAGSAG